MTFNSFSLAGPDPNPMTVEEVQVLKDLVKWVNPNVIINIGAERGCSTIAMLEELPDATIFSIDVNSCQGEFDNAIKAGVDATRIVRILGRSQDVGQAFPYEVSLIWVDGDHSYEAVRADILAWLPRLRQGGVIAFHDYFEGDPPNHNPSGAGRAVREEMMGRYELVASHDRIRAFRK